MKYMRRLTKKIVDYISFNTFKHFGSIGDSTDSHYIILKSHIKKAMNDDMMESSNGYVYVIVVSHN